MIEIVTEISIMADAADVWSTLVDFRNYYLWNNFMTNISGKLVVGEKLTVTISLSGKKPAIFKPTITHVEDNKELRWVGNLFFDWLFRGEHYFRLEKSKHDTRLIHGEVFSGLLAPILLKFIKESTELGFKIMNECLSNKIFESGVHQ